MCFVTKIVSSYSMTKDAGSSEMVHGNPDLNNSQLVNQDEFLSPAAFWPINYVNPSAWIEHVPFAFWLVDAARPRTIVELGSHYGVSYFAMCQAVQAQSLDTRCYAVDTWKGDEHAGRYGDWSDEVFETVNRHNQGHYSTFSSLVRCTFEQALPYFEDNSVDLLHVDGRHHYEDVKQDFEQWVPKLSERAVVLFHDTNVRERQFGVFRYWAELAERYPSFEFIHGHGLGVLGYGPSFPSSLQALFDASSVPSRAAAIRAAYSRLGIAARSNQDLESARSELAKLALQAKEHSDQSNRSAELTTEVQQRDAQISKLAAQVEELSGRSEAHERRLGGEGIGNGSVLHASDITGTELTPLPYKELAARLTIRTRMLAAALKQKIESENKLAQFQAAATTLDQSRAEFLSSATNTNLLAAEGHARSIADSRRDAAQLQSEMNRLSDELSEAHRQLSNLYGSNSWRLTQPIRQIQLSLRRLKANVLGGADGAQKPQSSSFGLNPDPLSIAARVKMMFDAEYYNSQNPDVIASGIDPFEHFMASGWREGRNPSKDFSTANYLALNPDVAESGDNPFVHWVIYGMAEGRSAGHPGPVVDDVANQRAGLQGLSVEQIDRLRARFDEGYYASENPDLAGKGLDLFQHFMSEGWREGRNPVAEFSTGHYLKMHSDIAASGMNPFVHWVLHGLAEGRSSLPFSQRILAQQYQFRICAIVPNYNHARFLVRRLESILNQTYQNIDVLILDDCSTDNSREIVDVYCESYPTRVRAIYNDVNSGSVFKQWQKGVENSTSDLIWICESDDYCAPDFVENLYRYFGDPSVMIAFGRIQQVDANDGLIEGLDEYRRRAEPDIWEQSLIRPAREWFAKGFGVNNVIANVGGCLWRRSQISSAIWAEAQRYSVVGDWFLYTVIAGGGQIAWDPKAVSFFRRHETNTSVSSFTRPTFYRELEAIMLHLRRIWDIPDATVGRFYDKIVEQYEWFDLRPKLGPLSGFCNRTKLLNQQRTQPHILIAFYGFIPGGGELFPINLANALHDQGWLISMLGVDMRSTNEDMKARLNPAIAVYDGVWVHEYGADRFIKEAGISLIHSHTVGAELSFFSRWNLEREIPYLVTLHGSYEACDIPIEEIHEFSKRVSHFVFTADKNLEPLRACGFPREMFTKLPNAMPIEKEPFPRTRAEMGISDDTTVFTLVARGIPSKGWKAAIDAFCRLRSEDAQSPIHLLLCGDGDETDRQKAMHGQDPDITFLGYQSHIHGLYRLSDVALVPSRFPGESFPLCIIQALQTGCPVIGTHVGEIASMVNPEGKMPGGIIIAPEDDDEVFVSLLTDAMRRMLSTEARSAYAKGARELGDEYKMERLVTTYGNLYSSLLDEKQG